MFNRFLDIPPVVKYLLLVNIVMFVVAMFVPVLDSYVQFPQSAVQTGSACDSHVYARWILAFVLQYVLAVYVWQGA